MPETRNAFTLVELLIVVVILGILAAVVTPQFADGAADSRVSTLKTDLAIIRKQIEIYKLQHQGAGPDVADFPAQMTGRTDADGTPNAGGRYGPYLQAIPNNPFTDPPGNDVAKGVPDPANAWFFDENDDTFRANDAGTTGGVAHGSY